MNDTRKPGRPRRGSLYYVKSGWRARLTVDVEGAAIQKSFDLGTHSKAVARVKRDRLVKLNPKPEIIEAELARVETFAEASERVHEQRVKDGVVTAPDEISRLRAYAVPEIGEMPVTSIGTEHVDNVLDACKDKGKSRQTAAHLKQHIINVFAALLREKVIRANPAVGATMPKFPRTVKKVRQVLTDEELFVYLAYRHPQEHNRLATLERQVMACIARTFGGLRTGDLHALRWETFDVPHFTAGWAPRLKTGVPDRLAVPEMLRPILADWWQRHGCPMSGLIFPARRGKRAGDHKKKVSHAKALRRDLRRAFGIDAPAEVKARRRNGRELTKLVWKQVRGLTPRERELFEETPYTLPTDFHSWRRAYAQGLATANVNEQQAKALGGWASKAMDTYLRNHGRVVQVPDSALPRIPASLMQKLEAPKRSDRESSLILAGRTGLEPAASGVTGGQVRARATDINGLERDNPGDSVAICRTPGQQCIKSMLKLPAVNMQSLRPADAALASYLKALATELAAVVTAGGSA